jgi:hypothetical protein
MIFRCNDLALTLIFVRFLCTVFAFGQSPREELSDLEKIGPAAWC